MKTKIKIDRNSISINPNAGRTHSIFPGKVLQNEDGSQYRQLQTIYHAPISTYSFSYEKTNVECDYCKAVFDFSELSDTWGDDYDGGEYFVENICPKCKEGQCCEIEFEKIEEAINENSIHGP